MTGHETIQCANCGQVNADWAKTCRFCAAPLVPAARFDGPPARIPTDPGSLMSIGATAGAILLAVLIGLLLATLDPVEPTVGVASPTPEATPTPRPTPTPEVDLTGESPAGTPQLLGTLSFGAGLEGGTGSVSDPTTTFGPGSTFAWGVQLPEAWGTSLIYEVVVRVEADGTETELEDGGDLLEVNASGRAIGYQVPTSTLLRVWGPGDYLMRIYRCGGATQETCRELVAQGTFELVSG